MELVIVEVKFTPQYAEFKAWAKLIIPQKGPNGEPERELYFGAEGIKLSHDGALLGDMKLVLLGNHAIPINGDNWLLTLNGGIDLKTTGAFKDQSFVEFDCAGLKKIGLEGDLRISRNVLLPINSQGEYTCGDANDNEALKSKLDERVAEIENGEVFKKLDRLSTGNALNDDVLTLTSGWNDDVVELLFNDLLDAQIGTELANALVQGKDVKIQVEAIFSGTSKRPNSFKVKYIIDGQPFQENFIN
ncbi:hypothetical protein J4051_14330 [Gelidibacter sp. DF109]|uniref:Uncharacterized protein n=1 Tax=Gelidibacter pelagius TaxID=2819985 RepID=A0ABS3SUV3_9FLAO|nr:hypothetical protein [Gelidibacter pelagius]